MNAATTAASTCVIWLASGQTVKVEVALPKQKVCTSHSSNQSTIPTFSEQTFSGEGLFTRSGRDLKARAFYHVSLHPHSDSEDVSEALGVSSVDASNALRELLNEGLIGFAD